MNQTNSEFVPPKSVSRHLVFFVGSLFVGGLTTLNLVAGLLRLFSQMNGTLPPGVSQPDMMGRATGGMFVTGTITLIGYTIALILYNFGLAEANPETHSGTGKLVQIHNATKEIKVIDRTEDGFYRMATESELLFFYSELSKTPENPRLAALIIEVRRRLGVESAD
jgi:hypothetical protein